MHESLDEIELTLHKELKVFPIHMPFLERRRLAQADRWTRRTGEDYIWKRLTMRGVCILLSSLVFRDSSAVGRQAASAPVGVGWEGLLAAIG